MSDIVERLRGFKENVSNDMIEMLEHPEICTEAADEIDRLRVLLREAYPWIAYWNINNDALRLCQDIHNILGDKE